MTFDLLKQTIARSRRASVGSTTGRLPSHLTVSRKVDQLPADAQALIEKCAQIDASLGMGWWRNFERTVMANSSGSRFISLRRGGIVLAVVAFNVDSALSRLGGCVGALSNYYTTLWAPALADGVSGVDLVPMFVALREDSGRLPALYFSPVDPHASTTQVLANALTASGYWVQRYFAHGNWYMPVSGDWQSHSAALPGAVRTTLKRMGKRLAQRQARIEVITDPTDVDRAVAAYAQVYAHSWKQPEPVTGFMHGLASTCAQLGWLRLGLVWLDGEPIAAQLWIVSHGRAAIYKLAYDERFKNLSAGTVLTAHLMEHVIDQDKVCEVDYLVGDDPYKRQWMTHRRERIGLVAFDKTTFRGQFGAIVMRLAKALRSRARARAAESENGALPDVHLAVGPAGNRARHFAANLASQP